MKLTRYHSDSETSYTLGAALTYEMVKCRPECVRRVFFSPDAADTEGMRNLVSLLCDCGIEYEKNDKVFNVLACKGNCYVVGEFAKEQTPIKEGNHIVLVDPSDAGNLGTIIRTAAGFGFGGIAVIGSRRSVDYFDPKVIRASMGAFFHLDIEQFECFGDYKARFGGNKLYSFMLTGSTLIGDVVFEKPCSLVFGNEATGLPDEYATLCRSVIIPHSHAIDSLNLPMAAGIAMYEATKDRWGKK